MNPTESRRGPMELIPESTLADDWYGPILLDDQDATTRLRSLGAEVSDLVPDCVGMSLSLVEEGITFTVASSSELTSTLDAVQYADDGPCMRSMAEGAALSWPVSPARDALGVAGDIADDPVEDTPGDTSEQDWHAFALASSTAGITSSLSFPIVREGLVIGGWNLYASTRHAFDAHHEQLATLLGAWGERATTNADLGFATRELARQAPDVLRSATNLSVAIGLLVNVVGCDPEEAAERLRRASAQSSVPLAQLVDGLVRLLRTERDV